MRYLRNIWFCLICLISFESFGQINIQFIPEVYGNQINGLMRATLLNTGGRNTIKLNITVTEAKLGKVLSIQTPAFVVNPGINNLNSSIVNTAKISISENNIGRYLRKNQYFPQGNYEYAYTIISASSSQDIIIDQTFNLEITPPAPLDLIEPYNNDQICEKRPMMTWQPSLPQIQGMMYQLVLLEVKKNQNAVEAMNYNLPIVNQRGIYNNMLLYPPVSKDLEIGKQYAWQVTAYKESTIINRSDVWTFKLNCTDSISNIVEVDYGYRDIEDLIKGNYYIAEGEMKFAIINAYVPQKLNYKIVCINDPNQKVKGLPKLKLIKGQNKIKIDFRRNTSFKDGYSYLLKLQLPNGNNKDLRFIYKELK